MQVIDNTKSYKALIDNVKDNNLSDEYGPYKVTYPIMIDNKNYNKLIDQLNKISNINQRLVSSFNYDLKLRENFRHLNSYHPDISNLIKGVSIIMCK